MSSLFRVLLFFFLIFNQQNVNNMATVNLFRTYIFEIFVLCSNEMILNVKNKKMNLYRHIA